MDWAAIGAAQWQGKMHVKAAEFLVADRFDWEAISAIGCYNAVTAEQVRKILAKHPDPPQIRVEPNWYY